MNVNLLVSSKDLLESLSYLVAILAGVSASVLYLRSRYRGLNEELRPKFSGKWTNEGCINCQETHCADLELETKGKDISGVLSVRNLQTDSEWNNLSITGKRSLGKAKLQIVHVRHGKVIVLGEVKLKLKEDNLRWRLLDGVGDFFPKETTIWKST